jgi:hypothetical protein
MKNTTHSDLDELTVEEIEKMEMCWVNGLCRPCKQPRTPEGHDPCLGHIPGEILSACCGHGIVARTNNFHERLNHNWSFFYKSICP